MAERLSPPTEGPIGAEAHVGWGRFADGGRYRLHRAGTQPKNQEPDFYQPAKQARGAFLSWASRRGYATHTEVVDENTLIVQARKRADPMPTAKAG